MALRLSDLRVNFVNPMPISRVVCELSELCDPGSRGFSIELNGETLEFLLVRKGLQVYAYQNHCPHTGINLEWQPDQFLDLSNSFIQCATHGALFRIEDGYCLRGPCAGDRLHAIPVGIENGQVLIDLN
ncbi:MAG: Rieske 2Fe-2S domain-containing protein [Candidatus Thiodiazotropha sp. L084R]